MIISEQWLRDWVGLDLDAQEIADCLTNAGLEVDGINAMTGNIDKLVIGEVLSVSKHPDADRLSLTTVDTGDEHLQIVCGATNVRSGLRVAVALVGAKLPNGLKIKKARVRGIESFGMLCSAAELGLAESSDGIMELDQDADIGQRVDEYLNLNDKLVDIDLTPNRGDCLSIQGIARELKVLADADYHPLDIGIIEPVTDREIEIELEDGDACPRYIGRVVSGIDASAATPIWMQERLRRCGVRPISAVVDIANYVMLELGQPMHAFDSSKLKQKIIIRQSRAGEQIKLLDDSEATLDGNTLVIADANGPVAIAGVMGGAESAIDDASTEIVLEAAHFTRKSAAGCARRYGLHTESSHRFERGVDPQLPLTAIHRATELVMAICGGEPGPVLERKHQDGLQAKPVVALRMPRLQQLLGMQLDADDVGDMLRRIAESVQVTDDGWDVSPPSYRFDIECEADLVEEVARVQGYDNIPVVIPRIAPRSVAATEGRVNLRQVRQTLIARDYNEAITYSFIDPGSHAKFTDEAPVLLENPLAENMSVMRTSLIPGLLDALKFNSNRQQDRIRLFEIGASYHKGTDGFVEVQKLAGAVMGPSQPAQWSLGKSKDVDFYDVKADLEAVLSLTGQKEPFIFKEFEHIALHPGQLSQVSRGVEKEIEQQEVVLGFIGRLHPGLQKQYGLSANVFVFELNLDSALEAVFPAYKGVSRFPGTKRDISIVVKQSIVVSDLLHTLSSGLGEVLKKSVVFDVYHGEGVAEGHKSVSLSLHLQHDDRTMTDAEAEDAVQKAIAILEQEFGAILRS